MAVQAKTYLDLAGLTAYDGKIKEWSNSVAQAGVKTILKTADGNSINFYKKPNAALTDTADFSIELGSSDAAEKITALANVLGVTWVPGTGGKAGSYTVTFDSSLVATTFAAAINEVISDFNTFIGEIPSGATAKTVIGYIGEAITNAVNALDGTATIASKSGNVVTIKGGISEADGIVSNDSSADITLAEVAATGAAADVSVADTNNKITATNVEDALEELVDAIANATDASKVTCETSDGATGSDTLKTYSFYQGVLGTDDAATKAAKKIIDVNIPKDYVVRSATVGTCKTADEPVSGLVPGDKYIDLAINTNDGTGSGTVRHLYIPFKDLMDAVKGSTGTEVTITVASDNTISATINKIDSAKIDYSSTTTVKNELDKLNGADTVTGSVAKAKKDAIDTVVGTSTDAKTADTVNGAKAYADDAVLTAVGTLDGSATIATYAAGTSGAADVITIKGGISEADGVVSQTAGADDITLSTITAAEIDGLFA